jgi:hypothetical protein
MKNRVPGFLALLGIPVLLIAVSGLLNPSFSEDQGSPASAFPEARLDSTGCGCGGHSRLFLCASRKKVKKVREVKSIKSAKEASVIKGFDGVADLEF